MLRPCWCRRRSPGAYIEFGAAFAAAATAAFDDELPGGLANTIGGLTFSLAYVLAVVGDAEMFTANVLMVMAWVHGGLPTLLLLGAWGMAFVGNFVGAASTGASSSWQASTPRPAAP